MPQNGRKTMKSLIEAISSNVSYVLTFAAVIAAMFLVAFIFEHAARKRSGTTERIFTTRKVAVIGIFSALACVLFILEFPLPFLAPSFYELDFSELPALVGAFSFGPVAGVMIEFIKIVLKLLIKGTSTAFVGDLANFVIGCSFILPASIIYEFGKSRKSAVISCVTGTLCISVFGSVFNALYLLPAFSVLYGMPMDALIAMGTKVIPAIRDIPTFVIFAVAPFNLIKGTAVSIITMFVYKKLSPILKYGRQRKRRV